MSREVPASPICPREFVKEYGIKSLVCCLSGGKDSLVSTHYTLSELDNVTVDKYVAFVDTTVMIPIAVEFVREVCQKFGWHLNILKPKTTFWEQVEKKGMPWMKRRWCCYGLKLQPLFDFIRDLPPQRASVTGLRKDESPNRQKKLKKQIVYDRRRKIYAWEYCPILHWTEKDVLSYIKKHNLPIPPHYRLGIKETCMCGAFSSVKEIMILKAYFPDLFAKFVEVEKRVLRNKQWSCFWDGGPVWARDLAKQKTLETTLKEASK